jgi:hypothetical protein
MIWCSVADCDAGCSCFFVHPAANRTAGIIIHINLFISTLSHGNGHQPAIVLLLAVAWRKTVPV